MKDQDQNNIIKNGNAEGNIKSLSASSQKKENNENQVSYASSLKNSLKAPGGIELPKGGGAIRGVGEKAEVNPVTGSGSVSIPLPLTPGRSGFTPLLTLSYSSGAGNSEFGLGWNVGLPEISRKTDKQLPLYYDLENSDTFILSGAEDLVPLCDSNGDIIDTIDSGSTIREYMPRTEGLNAKIERVTNNTTGDVYWRVTSKDNIISLYGKTSSARISNPDDSSRIFSWKLEYTMDSLGNLAKYTYTNDGSSDYASIYLSKVEYGNATMVSDIEASYTGNLYFSLEFTYTPDRDDSFSVYRPGFEVRNTKLCSKIEMHHDIGS
ncbi:MAG: toxin, partial [Marinilabiliales bacterium]